MREMRSALALAFAVTVLVGLPNPVGAAEPVVPGFYRLRDEAKDAAPADLGRLLVNELNCTNCHGAGNGPGAARVAPGTAPDLSSIGGRVAPQWISAYLSDPHAVKSGATMPDLFHAFEPAAKAEAVEFLAHFLASQGGPLAPPNAEGNSILIDQGRTLYHTIGCVACHAPEKPSKAAEMVPSVPHGDLAGKYTVESLAAFLAEPHKARPSGRMPSLHLSAKESQLIATYLLREQMDNPQLATAPPLRTPGLAYKLYERTVFPNVKLPTFDAVEPTSEGTVESLTLDLPTRKSGDNFGVRFTGLIEIPRDGKYTFWLNSDDGSRLYIDDKVVVDNDGVHPPQERTGDVELKAGDHPIEITFFESGGGEELRLAWQGPGIPQQPVPASVLFRVGGRRMIPLRTEGPFEPDPQKAATGGRMFAAMGCANCHSMAGLKPMRAAKPLAELARATGGCLSEKPARGLPFYDLSEEQRAFIGEALADRTSLAEPLEGEPLVTHTLAAMNCYACHQRGTVGGATRDRNEFFTMLKTFDMGDEGRLPPKLTGVGEKLRPSAMEQIVFEGKLHVRGHHMATRMPRFVKERMPRLVETVQHVDAKPADAAPPFTEAAARDGRTLVGTKGLGCVNCHGVAGLPSIGMPSLDLSLTTERLKPEWFHQLLLNPASKNRGTRMPAFWYENNVVYPHLAGGTVDGQIDAIWTYLSLGKSMGLPAGLGPTDGYELIPAGEPIVHRTFMKDVGPRAILVGSPDGLHVAFDADAARLAKAWKGRFFDAAGSRRDRGGAFFEPLGRDVVDLPPGPSFAVLERADARWPSPEPGRRDAGGTFKGYRTDRAGQVTFDYRLADGAAVEETATTVLRQDGPVLVRKFVVSGVKAPGLTFLAAAGNRIEPVGEGFWGVDGTLKVRFDANAKPLVRDDAGVKQLVLPLSGEHAVFEVEMSW